MGSSSAMKTPSKSIDRGYRFPADVIEQAVWLSIRFPLSLRMVEDLLAARPSMHQQSNRTTQWGLINPLRFPLRASIRAAVAAG